MMEIVKKETILAAVSDDLDAFEEIYKKTSKYVYNVAFKVVMNREDAKEITQDVFMKIYKRLDRFNFESSFMTWAYRITVNTAIDHYNRRKKRWGRATEYDDAIETDGAYTATDKSLHQEDNEQVVNTALKVLNPEQRACMVLRYVEGLSYQEIAEALDVKINTVRTRLKRAMAKIIKDFGQKGYSI